MGQALVEIFFAVLFAEAFISAIQVGIYALRTVVGKMKENLLFALLCIGVLFFVYWQSATFSLFFKSLNAAFSWSTDIFGVVDGWIVLFTIFSVLLRILVRGAAPEKVNLGNIEVHPRSKSVISAFDAMKKLK